METQNVKFSEWQEDILVDASVWREAARCSVYSLHIIRIFLEVTYRTFMPGQITRDSFSLGQYETQIKTSKRLLAWINATGAKVMSCETIKVRTLDGYQDRNPEVVYVSDSGSYLKHYIIGLRLYLHGPYADPPPGVLPPMPQIQNDDDSCTIL